MARLGPLVLLFGLLARCGAGPVPSTPGPVHITPLPARHATPLHVVVHPGEHRTFRPGVLRRGDVVTCVRPGGNTSVRVPSRPYGTGWSVGTGGQTAAGKSTELDLQSSPDGSVTATCR
jgi:hypothetical protein